jgi:hypothetical protein
MLIDLSRMGMITIDPEQYPTTLVIAIDAPTDREDCGVFAGRYDFPESEREKIVPEVKEEDFGLRFFLLDRPEHKMEEHQILRWYYAAIGWDNDVYVSRPYAHEIALEELYSDAGSPIWSVMVDGPRTQFRIMLPDYKPGAQLRGVKQ